MNTLDLWLPWPLSVNSMYRNTNRGTLLSARGREWFRDAQGSLLSQKVHGICVEGPSHVSVALCPPTKRLYDIDNKGKALLDALVKGAVILEDNCNHVRKLTLEHIPEAETQPGAYITIGPAS